MNERTGEVTFQGNPLTALGTRVTVGEKAPDFSALANDLSEVTLATSAGKARLIASVPSIDTPVCDQETRRFNEAIAALGGQVAGYTISADLPFAQARWCGAAGIDRIQTISDHRDMSFAAAYGTWIKELRLEQRAVFVIDANDVVCYAEYVGEVTEQPDYDAALAALKQAAGA